MFKRAVNVIEYLTLAAALFTVVMLFVKQPDEGPAGDPGADVATGSSVNGATIFSESCATCHGPGGEGGLGPKLAGGAVVESFPDPADQIAVVTEGRGGMPDFGDALTPEEIEAVVLYTRELP